MWKAHRIKKTKKAPFCMETCRRVFFCLFFSGIIRKNVFTQLFVPHAPQSSQDRRAELDVRLAVPSAQSACGMGDFMKLLIVVDMQNDFVTGSLGTKEAQAIVENVVCKIKETPAEQIYVTQDTHPEQYLQTKEGLHLPVAHCIEGTNGHCLCPAVEQALKEKQGRIQKVSCSRSFYVSFILQFSELSESAYNSHIRT